MSATSFARLEDVILDDAFPEVDMALRRGRHVDRDDATWFAFLVDAEVHLEAFYRRFGCELVRKADGYFYLLPQTEQLGRRQLSTTEMLVGQALTLLYLDPATVASGGAVSRADVLSHLSSVVGVDSLIRIVVNPKRKKFDERAAHETVRSRVFDAIRRLGSLGFVDVVDDDRIRLRTSLMRFAEPVRGASAPSEALAKLVAAGEVVMADDASENAKDGVHEDDDADAGDATDADDAHDADDVHDHDPHDADDADAADSGAAAEAGTAGGQHLTSTLDADLESRAEHDEDDGDLDDFERFMRGGGDDDDAREGDAEDDPEKGGA